MSLVEELHAARKARLARMNGPLPAKPVIEIDQLQIVEAKLSAAQATISELEDLIFEQRKIIRLFADAGRTPMIADVIAVVAEHFDLPKNILVGTGKCSKYVYPRHIGYFLCRQFGYSLHQTGRGFNRDHSTVLYGADKISIHAKISPDLAEVLRTIEAKAIDRASLRYTSASSHD